MVGLHCCLGEISCNVSFGPFALHHSQNDPSMSPTHCNIALLRVIATVIVIAVLKSRMGRPLHFTTVDIIGAQNFNFAAKFPHNGGFAQNFRFFGENFPTRRKFCDRLKLREAIFSSPSCHKPTGEGQCLWCRHQSWHCHCESSPGSFDVCGLS